MGLIVSEHNTKIRQLKVAILRRDVYWVAFPEGIGSEQAGERPGIIVSNDLGNRFSSIVNVIPLSRQIDKARKLNLPTHVLFSSPSGDQVALCEQARPVDKSRLREKLDFKISLNVMKQIEYAIAIVHGIELPSKKTDF